MSRDEMKANERDINSKVSFLLIADSWRAGVIRDTESSIAPRRPERVMVAALGVGSWLIGAAPAAPAASLSRRRVLTLFHRLSVQAGFRGFVVVLASVQLLAASSKTGKPGKCRANDEISCTKKPNLILDLTHSRPGSGPSTTTTTRSSSASHRPWRRRTLLLPHDQGFWLPIGLGGATRPTPKSLVRRPLSHLHRRAISPLDTVPSPLSLSPPHLLSPRQSNNTARTSLLRVDKLSISLETSHFRISPLAPQLSQCVAPASILYSTSALLADPLSTCRACSPKRPLRPCPSLSHSEALSNPYDGDVQTGQNISIQPTYPNAGSPVPHLLPTTTSLSTSDNHNPIR